MRKINNKINNKRGSFQDLIYIGIILLFFGMVVLIGYKISGEIDTQVQAHDTVPARAKTASTTLVGYYPGVINNSFLFLTFGLAIGALILAALVKVHPVFIPIFFIALFLLIVLCGVMSNIYQEMAANTQLSTEAANLTMITNVLTYLPWLIFAFGCLLMIVMYKIGGVGI